MSTFKDVWIPIALNFDPTATADSTGGDSCTYIVGCTDTLAVNFDSTATESDITLCDYGCDGTEVYIVVDGGSFQSEVSWSLTQNDSVYVSGGAPYATSTPLCLREGDYVFNLSDSYGDGWNGNTYTLLTFCEGNGVLLGNGTLYLAHLMPKYIIIYLC